MIYFAQFPTGAIKIGYTGGDVEIRIAQLEAEFGVPLRLLNVVPGELADEAEWHTRFSHLRISTRLREQFHPDPDLMWVIGRPDLASEYEVEAVDRKNKAIHIPSKLAHRLRIAAALKEMRVSKYIVEILGPLIEDDIAETARKLFSELPGKK